MTSRVAVVGSTGRVGRALCVALAERHAVSPVARRSGESVEALAARAIDGSAVVVNAAGVAHVDSPTSSDLERLHVGNVELPLALARTALEGGLSFIHVSSVKAASSGDLRPYAASKRLGDERLATELGDAFAEAGLSLIVIRPLALLFPPLDAGKVRRLRFLRRWPGRLTPEVRMPVLAPSTFVGAVGSAVDGVFDETASPGFSVREFDVSERGTLRDVRDAMLVWELMGGVS